LFSLDWLVRLAGRKVRVCPVTVVDSWGSSG